MTQCASVFKVLQLMSSVYIRQATAVWWDGRYDFDSGQSVAIYHTTTHNTSALTPVNVVNERPEMAVVKA